MSSLSPGMSRLAAAGILLVLILTVLLYGLLPLGRYYQSKHHRVQQLERQLGQYQQLLEREDAIEAELAELSEREAGSHLFLDGSKPAIASANLRQFLAESVADSGGQIVRTEEYDAESIPHAEAVGLQLTVRGQTQNLVKLLYALETSTPVLFVEEIMVTSTSSRISSARRERRAGRNGRAGQLDVRINIVGYVAGRSSDGD